MMKLVAAALVAIGLAISGWFVGHGFETGRQHREVTVKGVSERDVKADLALWQIRFVDAGNDLAAVQASIRHDEVKVNDFLKQHGFKVEDIAWRQLEVTDRAAQAYGSGEYPSRFIIARTLMLRSTEVDKVAAAAEATPALVEAGVILNDDGGGGGPVYLFNGLTELKPDMIAEATRHARDAATQFAHDSGSKLGGIVRANQGVFQILARDKAPMLQEQHQVKKTVRVVSTIEYALVD